MIYRLFGWWVRWQACKMAATAIAGWNNGPDEGLTPRVWSLTVFFEMYILDGAAETKEEFGPKEPAELKAVAQGGAEF